MKKSKIRTEQIIVPIDLYYNTAKAYVRNSVTSPPFPLHSLPHSALTSRDPKTSRRVPEHNCDATPQKLLEIFRCLTCHFETLSEYYRLLWKFCFVHFFISCLDLEDI